MKALLALAFVLFTASTAAQTSEKDSATSPRDPLIGTWIGAWESLRNGGRMEIEIQSVEATRVSGRVRATFANPINCSVDWEALTGTKKGEKLFVRYHLGGLCGKVDATLAVTPDATMLGTWSSDGGNGQLRLRKQ